VISSLPIVQAFAASPAPAFASPFKLSPKDRGTQMQPDAINNPFRIRSLLLTKVCTEFSIRLPYSLRLIASECYHSGNRTRPAQFADNYLA
jgi:hypothetical protein